jgi:hypothetical protein
MTCATLEVSFYSGKSFLMHLFHKMIYKFQATGSILDNERTHSGNVEEKPREIGARFGPSATKLLAWFAQKICQKLLHLLSYRTTAVQKLYGPDCEARQSFFELVPL